MAAKTLEGKLKRAVESAYLTGTLLYQGAYGDDQIDMALENLRLSTVQAQELRAKIAKRDARKATV